MIVTSTNRIVSGKISNPKLKEVFDKKYILVKYWFKKNLKTHFLGMAQLKNDGTLNLIIDTKSLVKWRIYHNKYYYFTLMSKVKNNNH
jgi:hypothetical protein